jgi:hypothetical protein
MRILSVLALFLVWSLFSCNNTKEETTPEVEKVEDSTATVDENRPMTEEEIKAKEEEIARLNQVEDARTNLRSQLDLLTMKIDRLMEKYHKPEYESKKAETEEYLQSLHQKANDIRSSLEGIQAQNIDEFNEKTLDFKNRLEKFEAELNKPKEF